MLKTTDLIGFGNRPVVAGTPPPTGNTPVYPGYLWIEATASHFMTWTPAAPGNARQFTLSFWLYRDTTGSSDPQYTGPGATSEQVFGLGFGFGWIKLNGVGFQNVIWGDTNTASNTWVHVCIPINGDATVDTDAAKIYLDGIESSYERDNRTDFMNGYDWQGFNNNVAQRWGITDTGQTPVPFRVSDIYVIDGQTLAPTDFAFDDASSWVPKEYTGTYGSNGYHLCTEDSIASDYHFDLSPNSNDFSRNSLDDADWSAVDGPGGNP